MTPGQASDWQERLKTFGGVKGLLISDLWTHLKVHPFGASPGEE